MFIVTVMSKCDRCDLDCDMIGGARWAGVSVTVAADLIKLSCTTVARTILLKEILC